jgi:hypothetical protein
VKRFAAHDLFHRRVLAIDAQIEIEDLLPHGDEVAEMFLLTCIFLSDLQFNCFVGVL